MTDDEGNSKRQVTVPRPDILLFLLRSDFVIRISSFVRSSQRCLPFPNQDPALTESLGFAVSESIPEELTPAATAGAAICKNDSRIPPEISRQSSGSATRTLHRKRR